MTEHERAEQFQRDVDALLRGETPTVADADDRALLGLARELLAADFSAETRLDLLRPRLAKPTLKGMIMSPRYRYVRWFVTTAALFTLIVAIILTVPPLRAIAQDILRQIGIIKVTNAPSPYVESLTPIPSRLLLEPRGDALVHSHPDENINGFAGAFPPIEALPEGYIKTGLRSVSYPELDLWYTQSYYEKTGNAEDWFSLQAAYLYADDSHPIEYEPDALTETVLINGRPAVWVSGYSDEPKSKLRMLVWKENKAQLLWLISSTLNKEEMVEIAESTGSASTSRLWVTSGGDRTSATPAEIAEEVGFGIATIEQLPGNMRVFFRHIYVGDDFTQVDTLFNANTKTLSLQQVKVHDTSLVQDGVWEYSIGDAPVEDITVNGSPGIWIEDIEDDGGARQNLLLWEQDGFTFSLRGSGSLTREEAIIAAESITYVSANSE